MNHAEVPPPPDVTAATGTASDLSGLVERVAKKLTDSTRNNPLIYYRDNQSTRVHLAPIESPLVAALISGKSVNKWQIAEACPHLTTAGAAPQVEFVAPEPVESLVPLGVGEGGKGRGRGRGRRPATRDPLTKRLQSMQSKFRENAEERGISTLFLAMGMVSWPTADGGRQPCAPLFFCPLTIERDPANRDDLIVRRPDGSDIGVNRSLLTIGPTIIAERIGEMFEDGVVDDVQAAYDSVAEALAGLPGIALDPMSAIGIFNFSQMVMVEDLHNAGEALEQHLVIRALAGDRDAQAELAGTREGAVDIATLDDLSPAQEPYVLDADPWQRRTIQTLLQDEESHATISGPPGTGKSQTIACLIASLIAQGKSVLFVCEKRAALDVVKRRLSAVGLGHLVLDVHGAETTRQRAYVQLREARKQHRNALPPNTEYDRQLTETRQRLNAHDVFMHEVVPALGMSVYRLLSEIAAFPPYAVRMRLTGSALAALTAERLADLETKLREASRTPDLFLFKPGIPWSGVSLPPEKVAMALEELDAFPGRIAALKAALATAGMRVNTRSELLAGAKRLRELRRLFAMCLPGILDLGRSTLETAREAYMAGMGGFFMGGTKKNALAAARKFLRTDSRTRCAELISEMLAIEDPWRENAARIAALGPEVDAATDQIEGQLAHLDELLGRPLADNLDAAVAVAESWARERDSAYRAARLGEIRASLVTAGLGPLLSDIETVPPDEWPSLARYVVLNSHLEPLRPELSRVDGRTLDDVVVKFERLEEQLREVARDRVLRAAAERFVTMTRERSEQFLGIDVQIAKKSPRKPLRSLFADAPEAMLALTPCVMASPISVSQFLPRKRMFDVLIADEASQLSPEAGIMSIVRAKRVVLAGDEKQLPPTDFFQGIVDDDDDDDDVAILGMESVLGALQPFCKDLDLRVHYRSRDERLIAFSNYYLYGNELITFPGAGGPLAGGLHFEYVPPSGAEYDENSSSPEVLRVVALILDHAEHRPHESLGVIALGVNHSRRIEAALFSARRDRPDLDDFFTDDGDEPFFVKNLERVQGDERDAIILTIGYGRTKTGSVSHNFGPINQEGGERRLNVAITRAKSRLTLVASFRKVHLNPESLNSRGASLLAAYIGYVEAAGADLGRDGVNITVEPNAFERDIQRALEKQLGTGIIPQYGVGKFRIDLAVKHPDEPGRFILAIECDGATYHSTPTARMRDRLRQRVLENLGWQFVRIWSTDWFNDRERELARIDAAYRMALAVEMAAVPTARPAPEPLAGLPPSRHLIQGRTGVSPIPRHLRSIDDVTDSTLRRLKEWIESDGHLRTTDEMFEEMFRELGFQKRGVKIKQRLMGVLR